MTYLFSKFVADGVDLILFTRRVGEDIRRCLKKHIISQKKGEFRESHVAPRDFGLRSKFSLHTHRSSFLFGPTFFLWILWWGRLLELR